MLVVVGKVVLVVVGLVDVGLMDVGLVDVGLVDVGLIVAGLMVVGLMHNGFRSSKLTTVTTCSSLGSNVCPTKFQFSPTGSHERISVLLSQYWLTFLDPPVTWKTPDRVAPVRANLAEGKAVVSLQPADWSIKFITSVLLKGPP